MDDMLPLNLPTVYPCCRHCDPASEHHPPEGQPHYTPCHCQPATVPLPN